MIDPTRTWQMLEQRLETTTNPRHRQVLEIVLEHMKAEAEPDLDRLMATVSKDAAYHFWGASGDSGPKGHDGVREYYAAFVASKANHLEYRMDRLIVDDHALVTEGDLHMLLPGATAQQMGFPADDADADYLYVSRQLIVWPVDEDGLITAEDSYTSGPLEFRKLTRDELPQAYLDRVRPQPV
ncbi:nuclear transport factor 2 family protein [Amycolatopsis sp. cg13]|uniref:nuclear transport factor 2 family protein n=1 Tax=Amycolatopsis sp. cg13 TaxID=3238807 RepID=UPI0035255C4E